MATAAADAVFLDTNVLVHANVAESPMHQVALQAIETRYSAGVELWVSRQVLREYLAVLSRPQTFSRPQPAVTLAARIRYFAERFCVADEGRDVTERLLALVEQIPMGGSQIHDANIATMQAYGLGHLLTENTDDFGRFGELITVWPLGADVPVQLGSGAPEPKNGE